MVTKSNEVVSVYEMRRHEVKNSKFRRFICVRSPVFVVNELANKTSSDWCQAVTHQTVNWLHFRPTYVRPTHQVRP
jgi:hypothetical protein